MAPSSRLDNVISLCKRRGFVFPSGEIYGGTRSAWDYGPYGVELKENIKRQWWQAVVTGRDDVVGIDSSVILPRQVWVASGHVGVFTDPLTECRYLSPTVPGRPPSGGLRRQARHRRSRRGAADRDRLPQLRHPWSSGPSRGTST